MTGTQWSIAKRLGAVAIVGGGLVAAVPATALHGSAATTIAHIIMSPLPVGQSSTTAPNSRITVGAKAEDANNQPIAGATLYLSFHQAVGGGTAVVNTTVLGVKPQPFTTSSLGEVDVTYIAPSTFPSTGVDLIHAEDGAKVTSSTVTLNDPFCYSSVSTMQFTPRPIARTAHLAANQSVPVTLTVFQAGHLAAGVPVYLHFAKATGGGTAQVGSTPLTSTSQSFVTNANGQVTITYTAPSTLPSSGTDAIVAGNESSNSCVFARDSYSFA